MTTLLRKLKPSTTVKANAGNSHQICDDLPIPAPPKAGKRSLLRRNQAIEDKQVDKSIASARRDRHQGILARIRYRVVGKAPTFGSYSKYQREDTEVIGLQSPRAHTLFAFERDFEAYNREYGFESPLQPPTTASTADSAPPPILRHTSTASLATAFVADSSQYRSIHRHKGVESKIDIPQNAPCYPQHIHKKHPHGHIASDGPATWIRMASEQAAPPVSYERLRQVTTEVRSTCSCFLS